MQKLEKPNKKSKLIWIILAAIALVLLFGYLKYRSNVYSPVDKNDDEVVSFQVKKGAAVKEIAASLEEKGLINSDTSFYLYTKFNSLGENILAGRFKLKPSMNTPEIIAALSDPAQAQFVITIQEGLRIRDIDTKLVELGLGESGDFMQAVKDFDGWEYYSFLDQEKLSSLELPLEGYIYPDTYFLDPADFESQDLIYLALDNFEKKFADLQGQLKRHSVHEIVTMGSIIENEVFGAKDRRLVSGILWKRLESGWTLGADATLLYITKDRHLSASELDLDSPYNTRKNLGLPPGPISNPSIESIEAAMFPESNDYWFYLTTLDTGEVIYARTNDEHNANRAKYL
ncbi:MAG: endolytic transglycosylase MltG [Patescibacteria group bacterium]